MKKPVINIFDTFEDADDFTRRERLKMTPSELIELCYELSIATWELHYGELTLILPDFINSASTLLFL